MPKIKNQSLSDNFIRNIAQVSAGYFSSNKLDTFFRVIETEKEKFYFDSVSEANLLRIILSMYNKISFIEECIIYPHYIEIIVSISAASNYLTDILVRDPEYFYWIINPSNLKSKLTETEFNKTLVKTLYPYSSFAAKLNTLKAIKRKEILRIGLKDILKIEDLISVTGELSVLAKIISKHLFELSYTEILNKYKIIKTPRKYCLVSLGKLGGKELNYSSDIDLMVFYDKDSKITNNREYHEILSEAILLFIESASKITENGYLYRVDFRLRPDGRNSPLCNTLLSYLNYYESRGEDWERQMLIKADLVCGNNDLYNRFIKFINPFIYPSSFSTSPLEQIRRLKSTIEKNLKNEENIKLIPGGIRNIEFSIQALQLLNGGRCPELQCGNTLESLDKLLGQNLLNNSEAKEFRESYIFYRRIEHYLQLMNDTQTHKIPTNTDELKRLSIFLGFKDDKEFLNKLKVCRINVTNVYDSIVGTKEKDLGDDLVFSANFKNHSKAEKELNYLREGMGLLGQKQFDKKSRAFFREIEGSFSEYLIRSKNPDIVTQNFVRVIRNATFASIWYKEFRNKKFFHSFLRLCEFSQRGIDLFAEDKKLREYYLSKKAFESLNNYSLENLETKTLLFHLLNLFTLQKISNVKIPKLLKDYFVKKISNHCASSTLFPDSNEYLIASMGSFGSGDMTFSSDIDLVFVFLGDNKSGKYENAFREFLLQLKEVFSPFEVDCRLRPEGKSSQLAWEINSYKNYIKSRARTWELQAFCRLSFVSGNKKLFKELLKSVHQRIKTEEKEVIKKDISNMRKNLYPVNISVITEKFDIKKGMGGIYDIDFVIQFLMITNPVFFKLNVGKSSPTVIKKLTRIHNGLPKNLEIIKSYKFMKSLLMTNQNLMNSKSSSIDLEKGKIIKSAEFLNFESELDLKQELNKFIRLNRNLFKKYLLATDEQISEKTLH
ncbi:MAG TPA: hypothetical protein VKA26_03930 [Ignavibacteriaceae bacterium]|nr:hypothetical protein [Ignavibacteriaceae bacterium]